MSNIATPTGTDPQIGPPPPLDPEVVPALRALNEVAPDPRDPDWVAKLRNASAAMGQLADDDIRRGGVFEFEERTVPGPAGAPDLRLLIIRPTGTSGPQPVIYSTHGGGMVGGTHRGPDVIAELDRAQELQLAVVAVDYRLAPENPHPAPVEDCYAGLAWLAAHSEELGLDPQKIIISGASAGGGLAAATTLLARDRGGPALLAQMLLCPMLDDRCASPSTIQMESSGGWDRAANLAGWTALLGDRRGTDDVSPYAAPARATDLSGLPPAFIDAGSAETFRDETVAYATRIWLAGGQAELHIWPGGFHGFDVMAPHAVISQDAKAVRLHWLRRILGD